MNFSKAFDTLNNDLLIGKLHAYDFQKDALKLRHNYLTKLFSLLLSFSYCEELSESVLQGSVFGPFLFNISLNDLFYLADSSKSVIL